MKRQQHRKGSSKPALAVFGLGRMGSQIARRLDKKGFGVVAWNRSPDPVNEASRSGIPASADIAEAVAMLDGISSGPRIFWVMLPHAIFDEFVMGDGHLGAHLRKGDIVIDGGNSFYKDSMRRAPILAKKGVHFFDCGTSGGIWGEKEGFALMVGGDRSRWPLVEPIFKALSSGDNFAYLGKAGAGHFVKMVHNGIEYGMMEAIGEGYAVLEASPFRLDLAAVTRVYQKGSVVRSWLIDLARNIFENEDISRTSGKIDATGEGEWTVKTAKALGVDVRVIEDALAVRRESSSAKDQKKFSNKIVALLRKQFGGHAVHKR
ncbi:MAG: decarboxylating 6-phosphogluconate dehydrogenase [Patescibacteria group bacterium]|nr:decarboxylating 6-phosphogluconate dehydrogenase [Patescibacteria group bacterium]MDE1941234.1 decarboxylating 6-phosphogluconate dehydrogenase [Patescibacteria group bacterium]MDE1966767.1 decarboxylating 6-phosphogluconate dehydrogenase [Patescibacteria group bacterium]